MRSVEFDEVTAIDIILYIANQIDNPKFHRISKIVYFADKMHLEKYGRFICGDSYVAMDYGPVPSGVYDILKSVRKNLREDDPGFTVTNHIVSPHKDADINNFSESDIECLDAAIKKYGRMSFGALSKVSHQGAWEKTDRNSIISLEDIVEDLENSDTLLEYLTDPYPG